MLDQGEQGVFDEGRQVARDKAAEKIASRETLGERFANTIRSMARRALGTDQNPNNQIPLEILEAANSDNEAIDENLRQLEHYEALVASNEENIGYDRDKMIAIGKEFQDKADRCRQAIDQIKTPTSQHVSKPRTKPGFDISEYVDYKIGGFLKLR